MLRNKDTDQTIKPICSPKPSAAYVEALPYFQEILHAREDTGRQIGWLSVGCQLYDYSHRSIPWAIVSNCSKIN